MTDRTTTGPGSCFMFSRREKFTEETAAKLVAAGACSGGIADPTLVALADAMLAAEARRLKFAHADRSAFDCLVESMRRLPSCAHIWKMGRVDGANRHSFSIAD